MIERLEELVKRIGSSAIKKKEAEKQWQALSAEITLKEVKNWPIEQKTKMYYLLLSLQAFGFTVSGNVLKEVEVPIDPNDIDLIAGG